jgi:hypothetical protein
MPDFSNYPMGRKPHDDARLAAVPPHIMAAGAPPPENCPPPPGFVVEEGYNLTLPTCAVAGLLNIARLWCITRLGFDLAYDVTCLLTFYALVSGCEPNEAAIAATDGLELLDVLETAQSKGFRVNSQNVLVPRFRRIDVGNRIALRQVIAANGAVYTGEDLYTPDMNLPWIGPVSGTLIGGHCSPPIGYSPEGLTDATWGIEQPCDDEWFKTRGQEAYDVQWTMAAA